MRKIKIFDTTLRDGEQSPGCSMNVSEKIELAKQLDKLGVDIIEAGFAIASPGDFAAIRAIASTVENAEVASLARAKKEDIDRAYEAVKYAKKPRIHVFLATSPIHMKYKLKMTKEQVLKTTDEMVRYAVSLCDNVEFSAEDASRSEMDFLVKVVETAIQAGAKSINIPDTVGYVMPTEYYNMIKHIIDNAKGAKDVDISVHCHNDLGVAVANSLAAIQAGATQVECTINGIGERAGNAALEEIVMNLKTRQDLYNAYTDIKTQELFPTSTLLTKITGVKVQPNKAIVGENAFMHESGVHQHGVMAHKSTYEIMTPEDIGIYKNKMVLGKHSGKHALKQRYSQLGYELNDEELQELFEDFKKLSDSKKNVTDMDLEALVHKTIMQIPEEYKLIYFINTLGNDINATSNIKILRTSDNAELEGVKLSKSGSIDAAYKAINKAIGREFNLVDFSINSVSDGTDAQGYVTVKIEENNKVYNGHAVALDIVEAAIRAYLSAINNMLHDKKLLLGEENEKQK